MKILTFLYATRFPFGYCFSSKKTPVLLPFVCLLIFRVGLKTKIRMEFSWNKHCLLYSDINLVLFKDVIFIVLFNLEHCVVFVHVTK